MLRRLALLLPLMLMLSACMPKKYQDRPPLQIAAKVATMNSPLRDIDRAVPYTCPKAYSQVYLWGTDKDGRPLVAAVGREFGGYQYLDEFTWTDALALVRASGYNPMPQEPTATLLSTPGWLITVQEPDLSHAVVHVSFATRRVAQGGSPCR